MTQNLNSFRNRALSLAREIVDEAAQLTYDRLRSHVDGSGGTPWDIGVVTGGVRDSLGIDATKATGDGFEATVGFDETGLHPSGQAMQAVLMSVFVGTTKRDGRPVIENTYAQELSIELPNIPRSKGLVRT